MTHWTAEERRKHAGDENGEKSTAQITFAKNIPDASK
jgi:hypothetical protein